MRSRPRNVNPSPWRVKAELAGLKALHTGRRGRCFDGDASRTGGACERHRRGRRAFQASTETPSFGAGDARIYLRARNEKPGRSDGRVHEAPGEDIDGRGGGRARCFAS